VLATRGEGLYHLGYRSGASLLAAIEQCRSQGVEVAVKGLSEQDEVQFAYMESGDTHNVTVELVGGYIPEGSILQADEYLVTRVQRT
jgi:hypothetical protein